MDHMGLSLIRDAFVERGFSPETAAYWAGRMDEHLAMLLADPACDPVWLLADLEMALGFVFAHPDDLDDLIADADRETRRLYLMVAAWARMFDASTTRRILLDRLDVIDAEDGRLRQLHLDAIRRIRNLRPRQIV